MSVITVYRKPRDYPEAEYVVRWFMSGPTGIVGSELLGTAGTLDEARQLVPDHMILIRRDEGDDPVIVESWI